MKPAKNIFTYAQERTLLMYLIMKSKEARIRIMFSAHMILKIT